jgi:long-chain acyl-CoA synthetase
VSVLVDPGLPSEELASLLERLNPKLQVSSAPLPEAPGRLHLRLDGGPSPSDPHLSPATFRRLASEHALSDPQGFERSAFSVPETAPAITQISLDDGDAEPRLATLTHAALVRGLRAVGTALGTENRQDRAFFSTLPFSASCARVESLGAIAFGWSVTYATHPDRDDSLFAELREARPTHLWASPRVVERAYRMLRLQAGGDGNEQERRLHDWALASGKKWLEAARGEGSAGWRLTAEAAIARNVGMRSKASELGGRLEALITGGDPLADEAGDYLRIAGIPVREAYTLTEAFGPLTLSGDADGMTVPRSGSLGKPLPGIALRISESGEVEVSPAEGGTLSRGDLGELDEDGSLRVLGRKHELLGLTGGRRVISPRHLETLARLDRWIQQVALYRRDQHYLIALITLEREEAIRFAREHDILFSSYSELLHHPRIQKRVQRALDRLNRALPRGLGIRKFCLIPDEFRLESGELTPQGTLRRARVARKYASQLDALYGTEGTYGAHYR